MAASILAPPVLGAAAAALAERLAESVVEVKSRGGSGAGTVWRADGLVITNDHVLPADRGDVTLKDGRTLPAEVIARDRRNDLAALRLPVTDLIPAPAGDARALRPGEIVLALGHPFGVRRALTVGVVQSHVGRSGGAGRELVYADLLLGPGNSGGPLVNARGQVVGINAMIHGGLALAVPTHVVQRLLLAAPGRAPVLGLQAREVDLPPALASAARRRFGVSGAGALVLHVEPGSAAERAGLLLGDVLVAVAGQGLATLDALPDALAEQVGQAVPLGVLRGGRPLDLVAALAPAA